MDWMHELIYPLLQLPTRAQHVHSPKKSRPQPLREDYTISNGNLRSWQNGESRISTSTSLKERTSESSKGGTDARYRLRIERGAFNKDSYHSLSDMRYLGVPDWWEVLRTIMIFWSPRARIRLQFFQTLYEIKAVAVIVILEVSRWLFIMALSCCGGRRTRGWWKTWQQCLNPIRVCSSQRKRQ